MEAVDPHVEAAVLWLAQTILGVLFAGEMEAWIRQVGLADDTERLKCEIERAEAVVAAVKGRAAENRPLARSLGRLRELLYDADDMVDELDYYRLQHQVQGGTVAWDDQPQGTDVNGEIQLVDGSRDNQNPGVPTRNDRKKRSKAWKEFSITEKDANGKPVKAECIHCRTQVRCQTPNGTSVLHNHLKTENCKRKRAAIEQTPNPSSATDGPQNGDTVATHDSDSRKRMRIDEESAHNTAANTHPWSKAEFCNRIHQATHQLQKAISEVQKLYRFGSVASLNLCQNTDADPCRRTSSLVQCKMYGRVTEKNSILQLMTEVTSDGVLILPIVGIGGIGKTALAQLVYNEPSLKSQFDHRIWIWVSSNFDEVRLTMEMLDFVSQEKCVGISNLAKLQEVLVTHVTSKKILLILDDVWDNIDDCRWNKLLAPLRSDNANGNVILVTTRKLSIAKRIGTVEPVMLGCLHTDDFWILFKTCAFGDENYKEHLRLNIIGRQIAEKLQGNPLAAETAGMLLREYLTIDHWGNILKSEKWKSLELDGGIMNALKLSYDELPYYLQQCFLYCSIFPKLRQFLSQELICNWISQGFLQYGHSTGRLEEIGRNYLADLVNLGFFEQVETQGTTPIDQTCYVIPGLMHDFARQVSRTFCTALNSVEYTKMLPSIRHLSIVTDAAYWKDQRGSILTFEEKIRSISTQVAKLRTLILIGKYDPLLFQLFKHIFQKAHCLRLLHVSVTNADCISCLCDSVSPTHLRYLKLENIENDGALSHSLSKCYHLQVLDVAEFRGLATHYNMNCLVSLRHLNIPNGMYSSIVGISKMTSLQELHDFSVEAGSSGSKIAELEFMNELLQLGVSQVQNIGTRDDACGARLRDKQHLEKLHLSWKDLPQDEYDSDECPQSEDEDESPPASNCNLIHECFTDTARDILEGLEPHHNLKHLRVSWYSGASSPAWLGTSVTCLQTLQLEHCGEWKILQSLGRLPFLTKLELRDMKSVIELSIPSLKELVLVKMPKLEELQLSSCTALEELDIDGCNSLTALEGNFTCLKKLQIWFSPSLESLQLSSCTALEELDINGCNSLTALEGLQSLRGLRYLKVYRCPGLPPYLEHPSRQCNELCAGLERLFIDDYPFLTTSFCKCLTSLQSLQLCVVQGTRLTDEQERALQLLTSLKELQLLYCYYLEELPLSLHSLPSLEKLRIVQCNGISRLPEKGLPPSLEELEIHGCSRELTNKCRELASGRSKPKVIIAPGS